MNDETSSSIVVTEIPAPYSEMAAGFTKEALATKGMNLLSKRKKSRSTEGREFCCMWGRRLGRPLF
jgi:hypothetical protein